MSLHGGLRRWRRGQTSWWARFYVHLLPVVLSGLLLFLASCSDSSQASTMSNSSTAQHPQTNRPVPLSTEPARNTPQETNSNQDDELGQLRAYSGPNSWLWRTSLPDHRLVIFYGNPLSAVMGPIGAYDDNTLVAKMHEQAQAYADLDPAHPVVPGFDYVTPIVQPVPMQDGSWVVRMPDASIEHYADLANSNHMLFFMDMQIGHSPIQKEVNILWRYIERPGVGLSLDPEFDMAPGAVPGVQFGRMYADEINWVIDQLSNLVLTQHLPPKILIIHQFIPEMLPDWKNIKIKPGVQIVTCVDGFGPPSWKINDYNVFDKEQLIQYPGMKLFYALDKPLMSPGDVLALDPSPLMVMYQ